MVDSDHNEKQEVDSKLLAGEPLSDTIGTAHKRAREESLEDEETLTVPIKKPRTSDDTQSPIEETDKVPVAEVNGSAKTKEEDNTEHLGNGQNNEDKSSLTEEYDVKEEDTQKDTVSKEEEEPSLPVHNNGTLSDNVKDPIESTNAADATNISEEEEDGEKSIKDEKDKDINDKNDSTNALVVDGLELKVECASDKDPSSSESEQDKEVKPRPKTVIVTAEPNESELEVSPSDGEKSDGQELSDSVVIKQATKREPTKGQKVPKEKASGSDEETLNSNSDDEDYSPRTKKKMKKSPAGRKGARSTPAKRGRGGRRSAAQKERIKEDEEIEEDDASPTEKAKKTQPDDEKTPRKRSDSKSSASENEEMSEDEEMSGTDGKQKQNASKPDNDKRILALKKYINAAGISVRSYQGLWAGCKSNAAKIRRLKELLEEHGVKGRPTLEKCRKAKKKMERLRDASDLDTSNIISEGRVTRARRNMDSNPKSSPGVGTPVRHREARNTLKKIQSVIDSDDSE